MDGPPSGDGTDDPHAELSAANGSPESDGPVPGDSGSPSRHAESVVITKAVRFVVPFVFVFGLFLAFHGAGSFGGGFQGGVVVASTIVAIAFAFGVDQTGRWLDRRLLAVLAAAGVATFALVAGGSLLFGGRFLELAAYPGPASSHYAVELVELGIAMTVATTIVVLVLELAGGSDGPSDHWTAPDRPRDEDAGPDTTGSSARSDTAESPMGFAPSRSSGGSDSAESSVEGERR